MFSTIPRIIPSKPSWPTVEVVQANEFKALLFAGAWPCLVGPGWGLAGAWPGLAGAWLRLAGTSPGPGSSPRESLWARRDLLGWNLLVILKLLITNLIQKTAKQL